MCLVGIKRKITIHWLKKTQLSQVCQNPLTLHLACHLMDKYLCARLDWPKRKLQLLACACFVIANKTHVLLNCACSKGNFLSAFSSTSEVIIGIFCKNAVEVFENDKEKMIELQASTNPYIRQRDERPLIEGLLKAFEKPLQAFQ